MADRIEIRTVTCPAGTAQAAAIETDLSFAAGTVRQLDILIPAGHSYLTGIAVAQSHGISIPASGDDWIIGDDNTLNYYVKDSFNNGSWSAFTYNSDVTYPHSWQLRFHVFENHRPSRRSWVPLALPISGRSGGAGS